MTKKVRIENADTSTYKVVVQAWDKGTDGAPDVMAWEKELAYPTAMTGEECCIWATRYLVVKEA